MKKLGDLLKEAREKKGLTLHEIGMSLKINPKILKAIEDGESSNLPAKTFRRGFVRSYAQYLRLDVEQILQIFEQENADPVPVAPASESTKETPAAASSSTERPKSAAVNAGGGLPSVFSSTKFYTGLGVAILFLLIIFVAQMIQKYERESRAIPKETVDAILQETTTTLLPPLDSSTTTLAGSTQASAEVTTSSTLPGGTPVPSTTIANLSTTTSSVQSTQVSASTTTIIRTTTTAAPPTTLATTTTLARATTTTTLAPATTTTTVPKALQTEVIVEALNNVTIKSTMPGGSQRTIELTADQIHTFKSRSTVVLEISDGGAVNLIVNGKDRGVPGAIGTPLKITLP